MLVLLCRDGHLHYCFRLPERGVFKFSGDFIVAASEFERCFVSFAICVFYLVICDVLEERSARLHVSGVVSVEITVAFLDLLLVLKLT